MPQTLTVNKSRRFTGKDVESLMELGAIFSRVKEMPCPAARGVLPRMSMETLHAVHGGGLLRLRDGRCYEMRGMTGIPGCGLRVVVRQEPGADAVEVWEPRASDQEMRWLGSARLNPAI